MKEIQVKTKNITNRTFLNIKNYSGIPYEHTISRKFAEQHFDLFLKSGCNFTSFISQPGWGKSIILSQLAHGFLSNPAHGDSALLFLTVYDFLYGDFQALSISHCIKNKLAIEPAVDLVKYVNDNCEDSKSKLVIFIDGFNKLKVKSDAKKHLFQRLHQFIEEIANSRIQLVMGIRSEDWARFTENTSDTALFEKWWFRGDSFDPENSSNVPTLGQGEIGQILSRINGFDTIAEAELKSCLNIPLYLQSYYELRNDLLNPFDTDITFNQIISHFIKFRVDNSSCLTEKMYLINKIIEFSGNEKGDFYISKHLLSPAILAFGDAYEELLLDGILVEKHDVQSEFYQKVSVHFARSYLYDYFLCSGV